MSTTPETPVPGGAPVPPAAPDAPARGCMRWGLVGCALLSVVAIAGMVLFLRKAPRIMEQLLGATEAQVLAAIEKEVPEAEREAFRLEYDAFIETAKAGKARPDDIQKLQAKIVAALKDNKVSEEELKGLTEQLRSIPKK